MRKSRQDPEARITLELPIDHATLIHSALMDTLVGIQEEEVKGYTEEQVRELDHLVNVIGDSLGLK